MGCDNNRVVRAAFRLLRKGHWLLWGNVLFMFASVLWLISPIVCWTTEDYYACSTIGTAATSLYLVDAIIYFVDWWVKRMGNEETVYGQQELHSTNEVLQRVDFYFIGNVFFLFGVVADFVTAHYYYEVADDFWGFVWYCGSMSFWAVYAVLEMLRCWMDRRNRDRLKASARFYLFPCAVCNRGIDRSSAVFVGFAWDMLGAILFFAASITYLLSAIIWHQVEFEPPFNSGSFVMEISAAVLFILNSAALFVNHAVFRYLKKVWSCFCAC
jgi:hypothetical protein